MISCHNSFRRWNRGRTGELNYFQPGKTLVIYVQTLLQRRMAYNKYILFHTNIKLIIGRKELQSGKPLTISLMDFSVAR